MFDAASRYKLVEQATMLPGRCLITRTEKGPFVDTGIELNKFDSLWSEANNARIYLSVEAIRELAEGAGLFDEVRERLIPEQVAAEERGYQRGLTEHGDLDSLADRLDVVAGRIRRGRGDADPLVAAGEGDDVPVILVVDGERQRAGKPDGAGADGEHGEAPGQGDGAGEERRPADVPSGAGDGSNPFAI